MDIILVGAKNHPQTNEIIGCIKTRVILIQNIEIAMSIIPRLLLNRNTLPAPVLVPVPLTCYFDIFDGLIQAYVFVFLTALFIKEAIE